MNWTDSVEEADIFTTSLLWVGSSFQPYEFTLLRVFRELHYGCHSYDITIDNETVF